MAIIGFISLVLLALYLTVITLSLLRAVSAFGGAKSDRWAAGFLILLVVCAWILAFHNAPFHITFN
jgi:hypothetical protein